MGYLTEFEGSVGISPPLNAHEIAASRAARAVVPVAADQGRQGHQVERRGEVL